MKKTTKTIKAKNQSIDSVCYYCALDPRTCTKCPHAVDVELCIKCDRLVSCCVCAPETKIMVLSDTELAYRGKTMKEFCAITEKGIGSIAMDRTILNMAIAYEFTYEEVETIVMAECTEGDRKKTLCYKRCNGKLCNKYKGYLKVTKGLKSMY